MPPEAPVMSNSEIADRLASLAQLLSIQNENPYKVKAYQRAAAGIRNMAESVDALVRNKRDLTAYAGIGEAISNAIREIVLTGTLDKLEKLQIGDQPRTDRHQRLSSSRSQTGFAHLQKAWHRIDRGTARIA